MTSHVQDFDLKKPTKWSLCFDAYSKYFAGTPEQKAPQSGAYALMLYK